METGMDGLSARQKRLKAKRDLAQLNKTQLRERAKQLEAPVTPPLKEVARHQITVSRAVIEPENLRWYCLRVAPQKEESVVRVFDNTGIPAAIPTSPRERVRRGKLLTWRTPMMPGYVLVGFPGDGPIPWRSIFRFGIVRGVVGYRGVPRQLPWSTTYVKDDVVKHGGVERLLPDLQAIRIGAAKFMRAMRAYEKDETVRIEAGPFTGFEGKVADVTDAEAIVLVELFGRQTPVRIQAGDAVRAA